MEICETLASFRECMGRIELKKNERASKLIQLDITRVVDEYCSFIYALLKCRKVAEEEYARILAKIGSLSEMAETEVKEIQQKMASFSIDGNILLVSEGDESQEKNAESLRETLSSFSQNFTATIQDIKTKISQDVEDLKNFKVVLFGRTKVGKSTVREALTKGDGASIGKGGQSTTIDINEYDWYNLKVYDTPGILSVRDTNIDSKTGIGDEERKAKELLTHSDIAIFMFASDNIEKAELDYLRDIASVGKEVLILLNVKADITDYKMFKLRRKYQELEPKAQSGHISRISQVLSKPVEILPIHAQAAFFSRAKNNHEVEKFFDQFEVTRDELYELSRFSGIRNFLVKNILQRGCQIRCSTQWEFFISQARNFASNNRSPIEESQYKIKKVQTQIERASIKIEDLIKRLKTSTKQNILSIARDRIDVYDFATDCIECKYSKDLINSLWTEKLKLLEDVPKTIMNEFAEEMKKIIQELENNLNFEVNHDPRFGGYDNQKDLSGVFKGIGITAGILSTCVGIASFAWTIPFAGWIVSGLAILSAAFAWLAGFFKSKTTKIRELSEKLNESLEKCCGNIAQQILEHCDNDIFPKIRGKMRLAKNSQEFLLTLCSDFLSLNDRLNNEIDQVQADLAVRIKQLSK